ncbi:hypothetical protein AYI70_g205 [Smittium culicis]|uniref:Uncharacterized protein n=1 Tax=Smittium culicis TaxID=133412 RepID=A0A1R1YHM7_9FUNG|nr:hypothetical protein AYI70_g205 [Smittium culicis]
MFHDSRSLDSLLQYKLSEFDMFLYFTLATRVKKSDLEGDAAMLLTSFEVAESFMDSLSLTGISPFDLSRYYQSKKVPGRVEFNDYNYTASKKNLEYSNDKFKNKNNIFEKMDFSDQNVFNLQFADSETIYTYIY